MISPEKIAEMLAAALKPLEWVTPPLASRMTRAETILGNYRVWTHHEADGEWFWDLTSNGWPCSVLVDGSGKYEADVQAAAEADYRSRIQPAFSETSLSELLTLRAERDEARGLADRLKIEAQGHAMEARTANSTIYEIYQVVSGATGEPGNWRGAEPVRERFAGLEAQLARQGEALKALINAEALSGVRAVVAGWNGENSPVGPFPRHPSALGATLPKTTCGAVYALDEAMQAARSTLSPEDSHG